MGNVKQIIVMRKDLNMRKGKIAAQASHASLGALLQLFNKTQNGDTTNYSIDFEKNSYLNEWLNGIFTKICLSVESEEELLSIYETIKKERQDIPCVLITDCGLTEFHGVPTNTCIGIGPFWSEDIDVYTKHLKLL